MAVESASASNYAPRMPREQRRQAILDAALDAFAEGGLPAVTMEEVARRAGVAKPVVYRQFDNAESVVRELLSREAGRVMRLGLTFIPAEADYVDPLTATAQALIRALEVVRTQPATWRLMLARDVWPDGETRDLYESARRIGVAQLTRLAELAFSGRAGGELDPELTAHLILAGFEQGIRLVLDAPEEFPPARIERFVNELVRTILQG